MQTYELYFPVGKVRDAGYLRLKLSSITGRYCTDMIAVKPAFRRQGIATHLLEKAQYALGYIPEPEAIVPCANAQGFWSKQGFETGFNQQVLGE
jgi:ribosomal protein S18 acetylase RimI-like enzyme